MGVGSLIDDGTKEERVLEEALDRLDEEGGEVPCMGVDRGDGPGAGQVGRECGGLWEGMEVGEGSGVSVDIILVGFFEFGYLCFVDQ